MASKLSMAATALAVVILAFAISAIVIHKLNQAECRQMSVPTYAETLRLMKNFGYKNRSARFTAQSIAYYLIHSEPADHVSRGWDLNKVSDFTLHSIMTGVLLKNPSRIHIINHPHFTIFTEDYDPSIEQFSSSEIRDGARALVSDDHTTLTDKVIYQMLVGV
jgi:hypothetical protein